MILAQERKEAEDRVRHLKAERAAAVQRERERLEREEQERADQKEREQTEKERKERAGARGGVRGVRGTRASMRASTTRAANRGGGQVMNIRSQPCSLSVVSSSGRPSVNSVLEPAPSRGTSSARGVGRRT
jgi:hypothetical protein